MRRVDSGSARLKRRLADLAAAAARFSDCAWLGIMKKFISALSKASVSALGKRRAGGANVAAVASSDAINETRTLA
jgi:transposase